MLTIILYVVSVVTVVTAFVWIYDLHQRINGLEELIFHLERFSYNEGKETEKISKELDGLISNLHCSHLPAEITE